MHVRTCRATVPDLKNGWTDCAQSWYTVMDRLEGCRAQVIGGTPAQFRTCKAHYLARSYVADKRRYTGLKMTDCRGQTEELKMEDTAKATRKAVKKLE